MKTLTGFLSMMAGVGVWMLGTSVNADTFGSGGNQFVIDFVDVGNSGNGDDLGAGGGSHSSPYGGVAYDYRISVFEVSQTMIDKATALGMSNVIAGAWTGDQPAGDVSWFEAAAFVNWLNQEAGFPVAYNLSYAGSWTMLLWAPSDQASTGVDGGTNPYRHKDAKYFLPSEDEWYKAAYHQNDGVTANYWDYPTGDNVVPDGIDSSTDPEYEAVFADPYNLGAPNAVTDAGTGASAYATFGQGGNVWEWMETAFDGGNDAATEIRGLRGGYWGNTSSSLRSVSRNVNLPSNNNVFFGFRVASVGQSIPTVQIQRVSAGSISVSWEPDLEGFVLQRSSGGAPFSWTNAPSGSTNPVVLPLDQATRMFRASKP